MDSVHDDFISFEEALPIFKNLSIANKRKGRPKEEEAGVTNLGIGFAQ